MSDTIRTDAPCGDDVEDQREGCSTPRDLGVEVTRRAIRCYDEYRAFRDRAEARARGDDSFDHWMELVNAHVNNAEENLLLALLAWEVEGDPWTVDPSDRLAIKMKPRGVATHGKLYLAIEDDHGYDIDYGEKMPKPEFGAVMNLIVMDAANLVDLATIGGAR